MVNSEYTLSVFMSTFSFVSDLMSCAPPKVVHPAVSTAAIKFAKANKEVPCEVLGSFPDPAKQFARGAPVFVSLNRFERKKMVEVAILALAEMRDSEETSAAAKSSNLIIAGGYDSRLPENVEYLEELRDLAASRGVGDSVVFMPNYSSEDREKLLQASTAVVYTPPNEHFGIVPLEAMASGRPVIACNSGGPRESVVHGTTGYLCDPTAHSFAEAMARLADTPAPRRNEMGLEARRRVEEHFSRSRLGDDIEDAIKSLFY